MYLDEKNGTDFDNFERFTWSFEIWDLSIFAVIVLSYTLNFPFGLEILIRSKLHIFLYVVEKFQKTF